MSRVPCSWSLLVVTRMPRVSNGQAFYASAVGGARPRFRLQRELRVDSNDHRLEVAGREVRGVTPWRNAAWAPMRPRRAERPGRGGSERSCRAVRGSAPDVDSVHEFHGAGADHSSRKAMSGSIRTA